MDDNPTRRQAARPRRASAAAELGANVSLQDGEMTEVHPARESHPGPDRLSAAGGRMERRNSATQPVHQRHMPMEPLKFHIPRKPKEKKALFQDVSTESREYEDMMSILTSSYIDTSSAGCLTYCRPQLVNSELLEKEFVEKRREMKADGRTDKELEESYCFLLTDTEKLPLLCEKGLFVGHSWITVLGNPSKGVYLSRYSDLLQINPMTPGFTGEILIFKVMKGKVKSIYENMKNLLDPTPRFDSHISKNASKVTSLNSYRAFELTQQYFYEYSFDELRQRPRQVCPYAVVSFQFNGKDSPLPSKPLAPSRLNSQSAEGSKERGQFTVWTGDLVKGDQVLFHISLRSFSPPLMPHRLPEKLEIGRLMRLDQVTKLFPSDLFSYNLYSSSQEVVNSGHCCSLLEVTDRSRSSTSVSTLLYELEMKRVVLVTPLTDKGFLFLLSSVQMATPSKRGESWKRCLQALFIFPETRDMDISTLRRASSSHDASEPLTSGGAVMPRLSQFIPALHHALVKARANPPPELSAGVERQTREYLVGLNSGKVRQYPMGEYESNLDEEGKLFPVPKHHRVNMDGYLRSYLYSPAIYLLSVARARQMVEAHCGPEEPQEARLRKSHGGQREATGKEATGNTRGRQTNTQKMQQLEDPVLQRNAENEVMREEGGGGGVKTPGRKRKLEPEAAERALKFLKASQEHRGHSKIPAEGNQGPGSPGSLASVIGSVGLKDVDLREDGSELSARHLSLLTGLNQAARGTTNQSLCEVQEVGQRESCPFDRLAIKLGLPTNCDIDLRKQEELEGSISSLEGFSPSSHSGEMNHHGAAGRGGGALGRRAGEYEEEEEEEGEIPWVLIPITGLCSERYTQRDRNVPQDPRFQHLTTATSITTATEPPQKSPTPSPGLSPASSPFLCPSPEPSPPPSPSQCPSPDPSPPPSPSQCPSPEPSPQLSPSQCLSPELSPPPSPSQCQSPHPSHPPPLCHSQEPKALSLFNKDHSGANEEQLAPAASRECAAGSKDREESPPPTETKTKESSVSTSIQPSKPPAPERRVNPSPPPADAEVKAEYLEKQKETKAAEMEAVEGKQDEEEEEEEVEEVRHVAASDKEQKGEAKEVVGSSLSLLCVSSPPSRPVRDIDSIVDRHLGEFSSEIQLLLQEESVHYSFPQSPHSTSNTEHTKKALPHAFPHTPISQFSQYVSFYNPCPPVQDYVSSLQDSINSMLTQVDNSWPSHKAASSRTNADVALASSVSDFVSSIRAANAKTGRENDGLCGEPTAAAAAASVSQTHTITKQDPDATNDRNPPTSHVTLSVTTSMSDSVYEPSNAAAFCPPPDKFPQPHWKPQSHTPLEVDRRDHSTLRTLRCNAGVEGGSSLAGTNCEVTLPGSSGVSRPLKEPSRSSEPDSKPSTGPPPPPPATALSSLISQLRPEVFSSLGEIIKDVRRNSLQFYLHSTEPEDQIHEEVKEHLLKQGNMEQSPVAFLNQENSENRLLVIIRNKDIAAHIHKIPGLVSLKRHPSVVFMGIDTLDDIRNNSYNELFVSGGCIVPDELVLNPDLITHDRLAALLMLLEQHSSPESVWRWKVHCRTHKKLKEQARFRRDAADLLDVLSAYQKRHIVEFLPYHHCDAMNHPSPHLNCLLELQARYTQYRHTLFLTEHHFENSFAYSSSGIIVASIGEILHDFTRLVGCHDIKAKHPIIDDILAPKGLGRQLSHSDSVSGSESSPSIFPEYSLSSRDQPQHLLQQSAFPSLSHLSDQLVPDTSCKEGAPHHSGSDFEVLRLAISQLRAERQLQQQQRRLDSEAELSLNLLKSFLPDPACADSHHTAPLGGEGGPAELLQLTTGRKAVADTLELIHSALGDGERREGRAETPTEGRRRGGSQGGESGDQRCDNSARVVGLLGGHQSPSISKAPSANQNAAAITGGSDQTNSAGEGREKADQRGQPAYRSTTACPVEGDTSRDTQSSQEQPMRREETPLGNSTVGTASNTKVTGSVTMVTALEDNPRCALPHQQHLQQLNNQQQQQQDPSPLQPPPHGHHHHQQQQQQQQQRRGAGLLQLPHLPRLHNQPFSHGPVLGPLTALGGIRGLMGPTPVWPGGLGPTGAPALIWGFQPPSRDFAGPRLLGGYHNPAGQGGIRYRGGPRGGGFNGM